MIKNYSLLYLVATASLSTSAYLRNEKVLEDSYGYASTDMAVGATNTMNQVYDKQELPSPNSEDNEEFDEFVEMDEYEMDDLDNETPEEEGSSYDHEESNEVVENGIMPRSQNPYLIIDGVRMLLNHCYSFESLNFRGEYIRHRNFELWKDPFNNSELYQEDSRFKMVPAINGQAYWVSFVSVNYPDKYMRYREGIGFIHSCDVSDHGCKHNASFFVVKGRSGKYTVSIVTGESFLIHQGRRMKMSEYSKQKFNPDDASFIPHEVPCS